MESMFVLTIFSLLQYGIHFFGRWTERCPPSNTEISCSLNFPGVPVFFGSHHPRQWRFCNYNLVQVLSCLWDRKPLSLFCILVCVVQVAIGNSNNWCWVELTQSAYKCLISHLFSGKRGSPAGHSDPAAGGDMSGVKDGLRLSVFERGLFRLE